MSLSRRAKAKIYTTHLRYPQFSTNDVVCALLLYVDRIFFGLNLREKTKTGQRIFVNFAKFAWIFAKFAQIRVGVFVNPPA